MILNPNQFPVGSGGFGDMGNVAVLQELQKALTAGTGVDADAYTGGRALIPESLENTLVNVLWVQDEARLFQRIKKKPIPSPVHQWDKRSAVGSFDGAWVAEEGTSTEADQTIERVYKNAKYLQTMRKASLQATLSNMIENALTIEQNAGALWIIRNVEHAMFYGNSAYVSEQPDGLLAQITGSDNILDVRGAAADSAEFEKKANEASRVIRDNYGKASLMLMSTMVMQDVQNLLRDRIRFQAGQSVGSTVFNRYPTPFGEMELLDDVFIKEGSTPVASTLTTTRPNVPTEDVAPAAGGVDAGSSFTAADLGEYYYKIVAVNKYGDSTPLTCTAVTTAVAGENVTMSIGPGAIVPTALKVYRSKKDAGSADDCRYMKTVAYTGDPTVITDDNTDLPGTSQAFVLTMDQIYDAIEWFQFLPLMKFDLYPTNAAVYPFLMLLFGALALKKNEQHAYIKNISPSNLGWF
jgi:hypothetical protein